MNDTGPGRKRRPVYSSRLRYSTTGSENIQPSATYRQINIINNQSDMQHNFSTCPFFCSKSRVFGINGFNGFNGLDEKSDVMR